MPTIPGQTRTSYASGEVNPKIRAATDLARFQTGVALCENMIVLLEAVLARRPGTRFIAALKDQTQRGKMFPFRFSGSDYYGLAFNAGKLRLLKDDGTGAIGLVVTAPDTPYELAVPWTEADLPKLRSAPVGNTITQACDGKAPQRITRSGATSWAIEQYRPQNGPVDPQNLDTTITIQASAVTGNGITLAASGSPFDPGHVDGIFRIDEPNQSIVALWTADEAITLSAGSPPAVTGHFGDVSVPADAFTGSGSAVGSVATHAYAGEHYAGLSTILSFSATMTVPAPGDGGTVTLELWAKSGAAPLTDTDGTRLCSISYTVDIDGGAAHGGVSTDVLTGYAHAWIKAIYAGGAGAENLALVSCSISRGATTAAKVLRRWQSNVYQAITAGNAGLNAPVHTQGDVAAAEGSIVWRYLHSGYGFVQITAVADANHAIGNVLSYLPDSTVSTPSYRWWPPAWCAKAGWPKTVFPFKQRLLWQRDDTWWATQPTTLDDFEVTINDDSAIARKLIDENGSRVDMLWAVASAGVLIYGMRDNEWLVTRPKPTEAFSGNNVDESPHTAEGSQDQIPAVLEGGAVFIGRDGKRLHFIKLDPSYGNVTLQEISVASRHIFGVAAVAMAWQQHPHRLLWVCLADGSLASVTFMPAEKVTGWARHPMTNCFVEDMISIPTSDNGASLVLLQTKRTVNSATVRYYEQLMPFFEPLVASAPTAEGAWFVDCGLRYQGVAATRITGADHLIGQTVAILANGHQLARQVVAGDGSVTLDQPRTDVILGIPVVARVKDLPRGVNVQGGSGRGNQQRASHIAVDVFQSAGGTIRFSEESRYNALTETGTMNYGGPVQLETKIKKVSLASATSIEPAIDIVIDTCLPFTLCATTPVLEVEDTD